MLRPAGAVHDWPCFVLCTLGAIPFVPRDLDSLVERGMYKTIKVAESTALILRESSQRPTEKGEGSRIEERKCKEKSKKGKKKRYYQEKDMFFGIRMFEVL
jgi:hypothetical protein